ncbi:MAG: molybdopterin-dependent oxidoreductase [Candidatus Buchananbacteria bacterium]
MIKKLKPIDFVLIIFLVIVVIAASDYVLVEWNKAKGRRHLNVVEINNYEGQNLSSVNDFFENSIKGPQYVNKENYKLEIKGLIENPKSFSYDQIIKNFASQKKVVKLNCVEGWSVTILWQGILLRDLFDQVKPTNQAKTVIFRSVDGYSTSFPLSYFYDNDIIMAYKMNEAELLPERGFPFQLVAESKWGYKWIKWISEIEFSSDQDFEGYWESRGYSDTGNLDKPFLK